MTYRHITQLICSLYLAGCASSDQRPSQADFDIANNKCFAQANFQKSVRHPHWFTNWLQCKQDNVMPMEFLVYPGKEEQIRAMYSKLLKLGVAVDQGQSKVEPVYEEYDRMEAAIGMYKGVCFHYQDGTQQCVNPKAKQ